MVNWYVVEYAILIGVISNVLELMEWIHIHYQNMFIVVLNTKHIDLDGQYCIFYDGNPIWTKTDMKDIAKGIESEAVNESTMDTDSNQIMRFINENIIDEENINNNMNSRYSL